MRRDLVVASQDREFVTDARPSVLLNGSMKNTLAREFQEHFPEFASLLDALLEAEKEYYNYPSPDAWIETHGFYPRDPGELTYDHLTRGHFTEAIDAIANIFGPCVISREACFRQIGVYPGQGPDLDEMRVELGKLRDPKPRLVIGEDGRGHENHSSALGSGPSSRA